MNHVAELYTVSKNNTDVAHFDIDQPSLIIFGSEVAERTLANGGVLYQLY